MKTTYLDPSLRTKMYFKSAHCTYLKIQEKELLKFNFLNEYRSSKCYLRWSAPASPLFATSYCSLLSGYDIFLLLSHPFTTYHWSLLSCFSFVVLFLAFIDISFSIFHGSLLSAQHTFLFFCIFFIFPTFSVHLGLLLFLC